MNALLDRPAESISDSAQRRIDAVVEQVVRQLLFCDEFVLTSPVSGTSTFAVDFAARGPVDPQGRSLRQFDLQTRLFRYPCSYLIYSESFRKLPRVAHAAVVHRLTEILTAADPVAGFEHLSSSDREAVLEILRVTHPDFAATTVVGQ
jgi:hypothetical protein